MKSKKIMKMFFIIVIFIILTMMFTHVVEGFNFADAINTVGSKDGSGNTSKAITNVMGTVIYIVRVVGTGISLLMLIILAIKYVVSTVTEKAEIKKWAPSYVLGAVIIFSASSILTILQTFVGGLNNSI